MTNGIEKLIHDRIRKNGPITIADYMKACLLHPEFGYYIKSNPFGQSGDFVTSPEISQMFGELLGVWVITQWQALGKPSMINLLELGPGRGSLMSDLMRVVTKQPELEKAINLYLIEISPKLQEIQNSVLSAYSPVWISHISEIVEGPILIVANEFFDSFPIHQFTHSKEGWQERHVGLASDAKPKLQFVLSPEIVSYLPFNSPKGSVLESSPSTINYMKSIIYQLKRQSGAAAIIDYGYFETSLVDTLQAVRNHNFVSVLESPGKTDLTAHVNFGSLVQLVQETNGMRALTFTQRDFLCQHGIQERATSLMSGANIKHFPDIIASYERLIGRRQMGELFKVLIMSTL